MANDIKLRTCKCQTCGAPIKVTNVNEAVPCLYCGNISVPIMEQPVQSGTDELKNGTIKVEGIKTSSSALAYMEQFFEDYDWEAFSYAYTISVTEMDKLVDSLKVSSADDKSTWIAWFKSVYIPFASKIEGCKKIFECIIEEYKNDDLDAYSKFDAYKRISSLIRTSTESVKAKLNKAIENAVKYGAKADEVNALKIDIGNLNSLADLKLYNSIDEIPEIKAFVDKKNLEIKEKLAASGIDAEQEYNKAISFIKENKYAEALLSLNNLSGYSDSREIAEKIDKYFLLSDVLKIEDNLYYFEKENDSTLLNLYPCSDGKIGEKPIIKGIKQVITNFADILYYIKANNVSKCSLSDQKETIVYGKKVSEKNIYVYEQKAYLYANISENYDGNKFELIELDLATGAVKSVISDVKKLVATFGNKLVLSALEKKEKKNSDYSYNNVYDTITVIVDLDSLTITKLGKDNITVEGFIGNSVVYTKKTPNDVNISVKIMDLSSSEQEKVIEDNVFRFSTIVAGKLFYYIGNSRNNTLISINPDKTERKEWPLYVSEILFEQAGWLYFIRRSGYNSILCKSHIDGTNLCIIASDIHKFVELKNGYLYYINYSSSLMKVRMDGSNLQKLCDDVETILSVKEDKIVFVSVDDRAKVGEINPIIKTVKSIYEVNFVGTGITKLVYNVKSVKEYDENTVYYTVEKGIKPTNLEAAHNIDELYVLNINTNHSEKLLDLKVEKKKSGCYVATCVYGSYDCPQVWTLRRYRDNTLASTWYGRAFIRTYYAISPTIVKWFGNTSWFKRMWRGTLDRMVANLQEKGVESSKYEDKNW